MKPKSTYKITYRNEFIIIKTCQRITSYISRKKSPISDFKYSSPEQFILNNKYKIQRIS